MLKQENVTNSIMNSLKESSLKEDNTNGKVENPLEIDDSAYYKALGKFHSLINDDAFKTGRHGEIILPRNEEERGWYIQRIQEIQDSLEELKGIVM